MNNADFKRYNDAKMKLRVLVDNAVMMQRKTQKEILQEKQKIISGIFEHNKRTPRYLATSLNDYFDGYYTAMMKNQTVFLYNVDGQLYKLGLSDHKDIDLPVWDTLPREQWGELGNCGGSYWRKTLNVFFDNKAGE